MQAFWNPGKRVAHAKYGPGTILRMADYKYRKSSARYLWIVQFDDQNDWLCIEERNLFTL
jgi:hypothetical protein